LRDKKGKIFYVYYTVKEDLTSPVQKKIMKNSRPAVLFVMLIICLCAVTAGTNYPKLDQRVTDLTNTLSNQERQKIDQDLKSYEDTTSTQIVVLMINSLEGESLEEYANRTFLLNKIGQEKKNNGVLLLISKKDRKVRIETGYGLEGALTDAVSSQIIRNEIIPRFKDGDYFGGIVTGVDTIIRVIRGEYQAEGDKAPAISAGMVFMVLMFGIFVLLPLISSRRRSVINSNGHDYFSGWGYGGGSFGGFGGGGSLGGGGFSGGGGMSGGGGASGSW
jgi:uncharacterized protein